MHNKAKSVFGKKISVSFVVLNRRRVDSHVSSQLRNVCVTNTEKYLPSIFCCCCISWLLTMTSILTTDETYYVIKHTAGYVGFSLNIN